MPSTPRHHRHHHHFHSTNTIPRTYSDLTDCDIRLLIPIFSPSASSNPNSTTLISSLPSHLLAKLPILSPFCSTHKKLNPSPLIDILNVVRHEVSVERLGRYRASDASHDLKGQVQKLEDVNALWMEKGDFWSAFGRRPPGEFPFSAAGKGKCAACQLCLVGRSVETSIALGGTMIASIEAKNWRRSKRIMVMEEWVKVVSGDDAVRRMWDCGTRMRDCVLSKRERTHVDEYVARAQRADLGVEGSVPARPRRHEEQEDHVAVVAGGLEQQDICEDYEEFDGNPFEDVDGDGSTRRRAPVASSVYSRPRTEICRDSGLLEDQIIELYLQRGLDVGERPRGFF